MSDSTEQLQLFYTIDEVEAKVAQAVSQGEANGVVQLIRGQRAGREMALSALLDVLKNEVVDNGADNDSLTELYNAVAEAINMPTVSSVAIRNWTVTVSCYGEVVGSFDVEAEDEDSAIAIAEEHVSVRSVSMEVEIDFPDGSRAVETVTPYHSSIVDTVNDELTFEAEEA